MSSQVFDFSTLCREAKAASFALSQATPKEINAVLQSLANHIRADQEQILAINAAEVETAHAKGKADALLDRLSLNAERLESIAASVEAIASQDSPIGNVLWTRERDNGLSIKRVTVPIGVLGMIYEARPNVTIDASALALKSQNALILRSGSDCLQTSIALHACIARALNENGLPESCIGIIPSDDRALVGALLKAHETIDVVIPRGGRSLIERVREEATMPVFSHLDGLCHTYIDASALPEVAKDVAVNAKMRRTGICGATETLLIHKNFSDQHTQSILAELASKGCAIKACPSIQTLYPQSDLANDDDWGTEYLSPVISVKHVDDVTAAIDHINHYGSHHTDAIIAQDESAISLFQSNVHSAIVMHNTSTQFADGGEFGMGAEIGIATGKFHARGPVGAEQLCTYKYLVTSDGATRP